MTGGGGADTFVISEDFTFAYIIDFETGDSIDLSDLDANLYAYGDQAFEFIGSADFSGAGQARVAYHYVGNGSYFSNIELNTDSDTDAEEVVHIEGLHNIGADDFVL